MLKIICYRFGKRASSLTQYGPQVKHKATINNQVVKLKFRTRLTSRLASLLQQIKRPFLYEYKILKF